MSNYNLVGYHDTSLVSKWSIVGLAGGHYEPAFTYTFRNFFHPLVGELVSKLNRGTLEDVLDAAWQDSLSAKFFDATYHPLQSNTAKVVSFPKEIDVEE